MDLHRSLRALLTELLVMAHGRDAVRTTQAKLAMRLGTCERTVRRGLGGLEEAGLIQRQENRSAVTGFKTETTIRLVENAWSIQPVGNVRQPDKMSARNEAANRSGCPVGQPDKMSAIIENSYRDRDRAYDFSRRDANVELSGVDLQTAANDGPDLKMISGGRVA